MAENSTNGTVISPQGIVVAYSGLYTMALLSIFYGAFRSAQLVKKHRSEKKCMENSITFADAKWFPVTASCVLFGLYCLFKKNECLQFLHTLLINLKNYVPNVLVSKLDMFLSATAATSNSSSLKNETVANGSSSISLLENLTKENISYFLLLFFCYEGVFALAHLFKPLISRLVTCLPKKVADKVIGPFFHYRFSFTRSVNEKVDHENVEENDEKRRKQFFDTTFDTHDLVSIAVCSFVGVVHVIKRNWVSNNAFGLAFTLYGIEQLHLSSFKGGAVLLAGLFIYDIFWVFATDVMSTVATTVNAPILLMFPQDLSATKFAMLGLGDIVIPGIFLALLLRFDQQKGGKMVHFYVTIVAYALGLMLTIGVMHYFKAAQPALLYLVPACLGAPTITALVTGDFKALFNYDEADIVKKKEKTKSE